MTFSKFEKYAAGKIRNHTSAVDAEALWNDILPHVPKDNRRWGGLIFLTFIGLIGCFAATFFMLQNNNDPKQVADVTALSSIALADSENPPKARTKQNPVVLDKTSNDVSDQPAVSNIEKGSDKQVQQPAIQTTKNNANQKELRSGYEPSTVDLASPASFKNKAATVGSDAEAVIVNSEPPVEIPEEQSVENVLADAEDFEKQTNDAAQTKISLNDLEPEEVLETLPFVNENAEDEDDKFRTRNKLFRIKYGLGIYGGYSSSFVALNAKNETLYPGYFDMRMATEEQLETVQAGLEFIARNEVGIYLKTGVQYSRIARKFSLNSTIETIDSVHGVQQIYVNNNTMDTIYIYGPVPVLTSTMYNKTTYNYFHLIDIPVMAGFNYRNERWSFGVEAGALFNISVKSKGEILTPDNEIYDLKEDRLDWFRENIGVTFIASVNAAYLLNDNLELYLAPTARLDSVFSTDANPINQKHGALGFNLGMRYFIGN